MAAKVWDGCVLTATNEAQAVCYRLQLQRLKRCGFLHPGTVCVVIPDPEGVRIGSGGATLRVLKHLGGLHQNLLDRFPRLLLVHSGGESRRIPHQSLLGKVFTPLPPPIFTLFEAMYPFLTALGANLDAGVVVACSDTWLRGGGAEVGTAWLVRFSGIAGADVIGIAAWGTPERGSRHGVYDIDRDTLEVRRCFQKSPAEKLRGAGVCNPEGQVAIDTGVLCFRPPAVAQLHALADRVPEETYLDLYGDLLPAMASQTDRLRFTSHAPFVRNRVSEMLSQLRFCAYSPPSIEFLHIGTTQEYLKVINHPVTVHTLISCQVPLDKGGVNLTYGVMDDPSVCGEAATLFGVPIDNWLRQHGIAPDVIWSKEQVADVSQRCLWNACLYPISLYAADPDIAFGVSIEEKSSERPDWFLNPGSEWRNRVRLSLGESLSRADRVKAFGQQQQREASKVAAEIVAEVETASDTDVRPWFRSIVTPDGGARALSLFEGALGRLDPPLQRARLHKIAADLCKPFLETPPVEEGGHPAPKTGEPADDPPDYQRKHDVHSRQAFSAVREAVSKSIVSLPQHLSTPPKSLGGLPPDVALHLPVRVDLAGGWTDTPPITLEKGGAVLNVALLVKGRFPISVTARSLPESLIRLKSVDQKKEAVLHEGDSFEAPLHLNHPLALHLTVLMALGILEVSKHNTLTLKGITSDFSGLELISHCDVPMGSGLGTSSILAGGLVKSIWKLRGVQWKDEELFNQVLAVEQLLTSGGGWQDQVGGLVPGWKLTTTEPGMPQRFSVEQILLEPDTSQALEAQLLLADTGQQRVAKHLLEQVVSEWLSRRGEMVSTLKQLRADAYLMRDALVAGDIEQFGHLLTRYWEAKKILNPETTNSKIDKILESVAELCYGYGIAGAGGGGFLVFLAKDVAARSEIEKRLEPTPVTLYTWQVAT